MNNNVIQPAASWVADNKIAVGVGLGAVAVVTGGAALVAAGAFEATAAAASLGTVALVSGVAAAAIDGGRCLSNPGLNGACLGAALGGVGVVLGGPELAVAYGLIEEPPFQEFTALGIAGIFGSPGMIGGEVRGASVRVGV